MQRLRSDTAHEDLYPSRVGEKPSIQRRLDPVIWSEEPPEPKDRPAVEAFERDGFLLLRDFFKPETVDALVEEMHALRRDRRLLERDEVIREPGDDATVRSIFAVHELSPLMASVAADRRLLQLVTQILGSDVYLHQTRLNYKPGFRGKEFYWHSDFETWHVEDGMPRMRAVSASILLTENNAWNGPLMLIPGSHRWFVACAGETPDDHYRMSLRRQELGTPDTEGLRFLIEQAEGELETAAGPPGTLLLFDCNLMHGSNSNISPWPRSNLFLCFNSVENQLVAPFGARRPRPEFIGHRGRVEPLGIPG